jgi:hypothetical protein
VAERLRALLEHPLDPRLARAIVLLACGVTLGFAVLAVLARPAAEHSAPVGAIPAGRASAYPTTQASPTVASPSRGAVPPARQDPQDRPGTAAHRRAAREIAAHRALQHVPYRAGGVVIDLVGARGTRAVLAVRAPTRAAARRGWRGFLRRFDDSGTAYLPRFEATGGQRG